jgi:hypothetical protein
LGAASVAPFFPNKGLGMSVLDNFEMHVQVWDGLAYSLVPEAEAKKLEKAGTHQITKNLQAKDLKTAAEFNEVREKRAAKKTKTRAVKAEDQSLPGVTSSKQTYKTRQMKAEE